MLIEERGNCRVPVANMRKLLQFLACGSMLWAGLASAVVAQAPSDRPTPGVRAGSTVAVTPRAIALRGKAEDASGGALPGLLVVASHDGQELETTVTNATGEFTFARLPEGAVDLFFHLDGFEDARIRVMVPRADATKPEDGLRLVQTLKLRGWSEVVTVRADPLPTPPPARHVVLADVPSHDRDSVCGPAMAEGAVQSPGTIRPGRTETRRGLFGPGDELLIDGGVATGLRVGENFIVRRRFETGLRDSRGVRVQGEHSSGLLQIVLVESESAVAAVVYACDEMMTGDYLVPFEPAPGAPRPPHRAPSLTSHPKCFSRTPVSSLGSRAGRWSSTQGRVRASRPDNALRSCVAHAWATTSRRSWAKPSSWLSDATPPRSASSGPQTSSTSATMGTGRRRCPTCICRGNRAPTIRRPVRRLQDVRQSTHRLTTVTLQP